jgi:transglutaminase-like putative cysteine protease
MFQELEIREGWVTVALLVIMLLCVAWSIQAAEWTSGLAILQAVVLLGGLLGIVLAKSRIPNTLAHPLSLLAGFTWAAFLTSGVLASNLGLSREAAIIELEERVRNWLYVMFSGGTTAGNYIFLFLLALLLWLLAYFSAWAIFRWQRAWWAVIVCGVALILNINAAPNNITYFMVAFVLFGLLLVVRASLANYEREWRLAKVGYSPELVYSFLRAGFVIILVAILLAWAAPRALASRPMQEVWDKIGEPWRRLQDQSTRMFQDLNYRREPAFITFGRAMRFGGAVQLSDAPVMDVESTRGRYWRVMVFHEYIGAGWNNTDVDTILIDENSEQLAQVGLDLRTEVTQTITLQQDLGPQGTIAGAAQPVRVTLPLRAVVSILPSEAETSSPPETTPVPSALRDPSVLYSREPLRAEQSYQVVSSMTRADEESLRNAGTEYPDWVIPRYLQLPESVPERVALLAEQITVGRETPYDKATAIERYLRDIPYNEQIEGPAPEQDGVDYFLFESREGYCEYYASAMVVMLRSVGVPARYVEGFSQGQREEGVYRVLEKDGHAWPEVYFPAYGWVEFEPTAGEPVLLRRQSQNDSAEGRADDRSRTGPQRDLGIEMEDPFAEDYLDTWPTPESESFLQRIGRWGGFTLAMSAMVLVTAALLMVRRRRHIEGLSVAERVYEDLVEWVRRLLRLKPLAHQTPNEYANAVSWLVPQGRETIEQIADLYVEERFGAKTVSGEEAETAWRGTWPLLWRRWVRRQGERLGSLRFRLIKVSPQETGWNQIQDSEKQ